MQRYAVTWTDGYQLTVDANDGTEAKATARGKRGVKKSEIPIARVEPLGGADAAKTPARAGDAQ